MIPRSQPWRQRLRGDGIILFLLWLGTAIADGIWLILDHTPPGWDQGSHLSQAIHAWQLFQPPEIFDPEWWHQLWSLSASYRGPLVYLLTVPFLERFGLGQDQAILVNLVFTAMILVSVYGLGRALFDRTTGVWAASLAAIAPSLVYQRTDYLLDYGLTAMVTVTFASLTLWRLSFKPQERWGWSCCFGISLGLVCLTKATGFLFLIFPGVCVAIELLLQLGNAFRGRKPGNLYQGLTAYLQLSIALGLALFLCGFWISTNWLTILTSGLGANAVGNSEADPGAGTLAGWFHYGAILPGMISPPVVAASLGGIVLTLPRWFRQHKQSQKWNSQWLWLLSYCLGAYLLCSLGTNKDPRFLLPVVPGMLLVLSRYLVTLPRTWGSILRWLAVDLTVGLLVLNLFPLAGLAQFPAQHRLYPGLPFPHQQVIQAVLDQAPYQQSTLGMGTSSPQVNGFNLDFYGALAHFQVYARERTGPANQEVDSQGWDWYVTQTNSPEELGPEQHQFAQKIINDPDLDVLRTWNLPDGSLLRLHHRLVPRVRVEPLHRMSNPSLDQVQLQAVQLASTAIAGQPLPVTYNLIGPWQQLQQGVIVLTWQAEPQPASGTTNFWVHDHGIGLGTLMSSYPRVNPTASFRVIEHLTMLPPRELKPGRYQLIGTYLNRNTGDTYPLEMPAVVLQINSQASPMPPPVLDRLDLLSQFRELVLPFRQGKLDPIFETIARIHQYDPTQDYLAQLQQAVKLRLTQDPNHLDWLYTLALSQMLERQPEMIATLDRLTTLDPNNPAPWLYLTIAYLYDWQPAQAETTLAQAVQLKPNLAEKNLLQGIAALMQGQFWRLQPVLRSG